jgi:hypothetical protein
MSENIKQRYNATTQTTTSNPFRNIDLSDGTPAIDGDVIVFGGICDSAGTAVDFATQTTLAAINTKLPALGQALAAASVPVVLTAAQITTLTPPAAITGFALESTLGTLSAKFASGTVIGDVNLGATDNAVLDAIAASLAGTLTVGSHAVTNAGTFAVQVSSALPAGTNNIGDVDVLTVPADPFGVNADAASATGSISAKLRFIASTGIPITGTAITHLSNISTNTLIPALAINTPGSNADNAFAVQGVAGMIAVKVDGSAVTQPVSGTVTADLGATDNAVLDAIAASLAGTLTVGSHAVTNAGTFAVQSTIQAGTALIGKASVGDNSGIAYLGTTEATVKYAAIAASSSGNNTIVAAVASKKIRVLAYNFMGNGAVNAKWQSGASGTDLTGLKYIAAAGGGICAPYNKDGWFETGSNTLLNLNLSGAVAVGGELTYIEV